MCSVLIGMLRYSLSQLLDVICLTIYKQATANKCMENCGYDHEKPNIVCKVIGFAIWYPPEKMGNFQSY